MIKPLNYLVLSDVHLGHQRTKTEEILRNLRIFFYDFSDQSPYTTLDMIIIAGDLFDDLLDFGSEDIDLIAIWLHCLIKFCARHNIILRVLEGTPSHDRNQSKFLVTIFEVSQLSANVRYVKNIEIEFVKELGIHILYVPDITDMTADQIYVNVQQLLKEHGILQVDIAAIHGVFQYQLAGVPGHGVRHSEQAYLDIVRYYINIGHHHTFSTYERIVAQGSFDRLAHGQEEPKGAVLMHIGPEPRFEFIENKHAKIYKTIKFKSMDFEKSQAQLERELKKIPENSYVRINASRHHPFYTSVDRFKTEYPMFYFSRIDSEKEDNQQQLVSINIDQGHYTPIQISPDNIVELLMASVKQNYQLLDSELRLMSEILEQQREQLT